MSRPSKRPRPATWCWRRWIASEEIDAWSARLQAIAGTSWTLTASPQHKRVLAAIHGESRSAAYAWQRRLGGRVAKVMARSAKPSAPLRIGRKFEVVHEDAPPARRGSLPRLRIPHGMAFGSGEHATTAMLLRALARRSLKGCRVLDLGTGSGILALAARLLDAREIEGTDFDPDAIRTARQNERLNFRVPRIRWRREVVTRTRAGADRRFDIVLANLYSGILVDAAKGIAAAVAPAGRLWLSGILRGQEGEVVAAYRRQGLVLVRSARRGKWFVLELEKKF